MASNTVLSIALGLVFVGGLILLFIYWLARQVAKQVFARPHTLPSVLNLADAEDGVVVAEMQGRIVYLNENVREWFGFNGEEPNLDRLSRIADPSDTFLELFAGEGRASFRIGEHYIDAVSHQIPITAQLSDERRIVIVMKDRITPEAIESGLMDPVKAMQSVAEIAESADRQDSLSAVAHSMLQVLGHLIPFDSAEVSLYDADARVVKPIAHVALDDYAVMLQKHGEGVYKEGEGYSGWLYRYRQPLIISDMALRRDVTPKMPVIMEHWHSYLGVPLLLNDRFVGSIELLGQEKNVFDHDDLNLLHVVSGQFAILAENTRIREDYDTRLTEIEGLRRITDAVRVAETPHQLYAHITAHIAESVGLTMCGVLLYNAKENALIVQPPFFGMPIPMLEFYKLPLLPGTHIHDIWENVPVWFSNDLSGENIFREIGLEHTAETLGMRSTVFVRMEVGGRKFGVLQAANKRDRTPFTRRDINLLKLFAAQTALVADNMRLYEGNRLRAIELSGLQAISEGMIEAGDMPALYAHIVDSVAEHMGVSVSGILLYDEDAGALVSQQPFRGIAPEKLETYRIPIEAGSHISIFWDKERAWYANDLIPGGEADQMGLAEPFKAIGVERTAIAALVVGGRMLGLLQAANKHSGEPFTADDAHALAIYAAQAAVVIDNARLYAQSERQAQRAEAIRRITRLTDSAVTPEEVYREAMPEVVSMLGAQHGAIMIYDEVEGVLAANAQSLVGLTPAMANRMRLDARDVAFEKTVMMSGRPIITEHFSSDPDVFEAYRRMMPDVERLVCMPLSIQGRGAGEIIVAGRDDAFTESDIDLLKVLSAQMGAAVERTRLYSAGGGTAERLAEIEALARISHEITLTVEWGGILQLVTQEARRTIKNAVGCTVALLATDLEGRPLSPPQLDHRVTAGKLSLPETLADIERIAVEDGTDVIVNNYAAERPNLDVFPEGSVSALLVPMIYQGTVYGLLHIFGTQVAAFTSRDQDFARALVNSLAIAYGNADRYQAQLEREEQLAERAIQLRRIYEIGRMARADSTLEEILTEVVFGVQETVGFGMVLIRLLNEDTGNLHAFASAGVPMPKLEQLKASPPKLSTIEGLMQDRFLLGASYFLPAERQENLVQTTTGEFVIVEQEGEDQHIPPEELWNERDMLIVPLRGVGGSLLGVMTVDSPRNRRRPERQTIEALEIFADQAAGAIENQRLYGALQSEAETVSRERDRLETLHEVATRVQKTRGLPGKLNFIVEGIHDAGWERVHLALYDEDFRVKMMITEGYSREQDNHLRQNVLSGQDWQNYIADLDFETLRVGSAYYLRFDDPWVQVNFPHIPPDTPLDSPLWDEVPEPRERGKWHPLDKLYLPLYDSNNQILGMVGMEAPADGSQPTQNSLRPIELFANQAASVIENTDLLMRTSRIASQESLVGEMTSAIASSLEVSDVLTSVGRGLIQILPYTHLSASLLDRQHRRFNVWRALEVSDEETTVIADPPIFLNGSATGDVFRTREQRLFELEQETYAEPDLQSWNDFGLNTLLLVPMMAGGRPVGVLNIGSELMDAFGFAEFADITQRLANLAAISFENARLYQQSAERGRFNAALSRVSAALNATLDLSGVLDLVCEESLDILDVDGAFIWQLQGEELVGVAAAGRGEEHVMGQRVSTARDDLLGSVAIREQRPRYLNADDLNGDVNIILPDEMGVSAILAVPLVQEERALGVLVLIHTHEGEEFTNRDVDQASAFAVQGAIAIENARLYEESASLQAFNAQRADQLSALTEVSSEMTASLNVDEVVESVMEHIGRVLPYDSMALWLREGDGLRIAAADGYEEDMRGISISLADSRLFTDMAERLQPLCVVDMREDVRFPGSEMRENRSWLGAPLRSKGEIIGLLTLEKREVGFYDAAYEQVAFAFANQAAVAIENARLFEETVERSRELDQRTRRLGLLNRVSLGLAQGIDTANIMKIALQEGAAFLETDQAMALTINTERDTAEVVAEHPVPTFAPGHKLPLTHNAAFDRVRETGSPLMLDDVIGDPLLESLQDILRRRETRAMLIMPLTIATEVTGLLLFEDKEQGRRFGSEQIEVMGTIANQTAVATQTSRLVEQSFTRTREMETLLDAAQSTSLALELDAVIERGVIHFSQALQVQHCTISLWRDVRNALEVLGSFSMGGPGPEKGTYYGLIEHTAKAQVMESRQPIILHAGDAEGDPLESQILEEHGASSRMIVPMVARERSIGVVELEYAFPDFDFGISEQRIARTMANQVAVAIDNALLQLETQSQVEQMMTITELSQRIAGTIELDEMFAMLRVQLPNLLRAKNLYIAVYDAVTDEISYPVSIEGGEEKPRDPHPLNGDVASYLVKRHMTLFLFGAMLEGLAKNLKLTHLPPRVQSLLGLPLSVRGDAIGGIVVYDMDDPNAFSGSDQNVLKTIAGQISVAIQNARLFQEQRAFTQRLEEAVNRATEDLIRERDRLETLFEVTGILTASLDTEATMSRALDRLAAAVGAPNGTIFRYEEATANLELQAMVGRTPYDLGNVKPEEMPCMECGLTAWLIENRESLLIGDLAKDARFSSVDTFHSVIAAPLEIGEDLLGVIVLMSPEMDAFDKGHLQLVTTASSQIATAFNNAILYNKVREQSHQMGQMLRTSQTEAAKSGAILEGVADGVMFADQKGQIVLFNDAAERILGVSGENVVGQPLSRLAGIYGDQAGAWFDAIRSWSAQGTSSENGEEAIRYLEERFQLGDRFVSVHLSPVTMQNQFVGTVSLVRDITRDVEVDRMKSEFVSTVSHELRTPMTSIKGYADLLILGAAGPTTDQQGQFLKIIKENADRLSALVNDLLEISRLEQGKIQLERIRVDVGEILNGGLQDLQDMGKEEQKELVIEVDAPPEMPAVYVDPARMNQVMENLVTNAFQYTPAGGKITLSARALPNEEGVEISVRDTGMGMTEETLKHIFERFYRGSNAVVMETPGTGLGLSIVQQLVEMHGGKIWAESEPDEGTTFTLTLPIYREEDTE